MYVGEEIRLDFHPKKTFQEHSKAIMLLYCMCICAKSMHL